MQWVGSVNGSTLRLHRRSRGSNPLLSTILPKWLNRNSRSLVNFHFRVRISASAPNFMPYKDKNVQREYNRQWQASRRAEWFFEKVCVRCGGSDSLEIHHEDPLLKISHKVWSWAQERRDEELAKCVVLCHACHKAQHATKCGTTRSYKNGCRCDDCRRANTLERRRHRSIYGRYGSAAKGFIGAKRA